jgi:UDP-glucose 4-epimerase
LFKRALVTGCAGFIGSHLVERLLQNEWDVVGVDNFSSGSKSNLNEADKYPRFHFIEGDIVDYATITRALRECELVFHLAANPEVQAGSEQPSLHFQQNLITTFNLLEAIRDRRSSTRFVFASTSTVYGEPSLIPTPEDYGPLFPISVYGSTKLGCEALASSYTQLMPVRAVIFRFANVVGARANHGVIYDFIRKLEKNPAELEVLGDGTQTKSYMHINDCVDAFLMTINESFWKTTVDVYNIGTDGQTNVLRIAQVVIDAMGLRDVRIRTKPGPQGRGWPGDVKVMQLDVRKIKSQGWKPKLSSDEAVTLAARELTSTKQ